MVTCHLHYFFIHKSYQICIVNSFVQFGRYIWTRFHQISIKQQYIVIFFVGTKKKLDGLVKMNLCKKELESQFSILFSPFAYIFFITWFITFSTLESSMIIFGFWRQIELQFSKISPLASFPTFISHSKEKQLAQSICAKNFICQINLKFFHVQFPK
jgi:hypothetical protein